MPLFAPKKTRTARAATLKPASKATRWFQITFRNRETLLRLGLCALSILLLLLAVQAWQAPFTYRLGDQTSQGITAKVPFRHPNRFKTEQARLEAEAKVYPIFVNNPQELDTLAAELRSSLADIAKAKNVEDLQPEALNLFGLNVPGNPQDMHTEFSTLKALVAKEDNVEGNRIDELANDFSRLIEPLKKRGIMDPADMVETGIALETQITIQREGNPAEWDVVLAGNVLMDELVQDTGSLMASIHKEYPELVPLKTYLKRWLLSKSLVTLRYDEDRTRFERSEARNSAEEQFDEYHRNDILVEPSLPSDPDKGRIDEERLAVLMSQYDEMRRLATTTQKSIRFAAVGLMLSVLFALNGLYLVRSQPEIAYSVRRLGVFLGVVVLAVAVGRWVSFDPWRAEIIPLMAVAMVFAIAYNQVLATLTALLLVPGHHAVHAGGPWPVRGPLERRGGLDFDPLANPVAVHADQGRLLVGPGVFPGVLWARDHPDPSLHQSLGRFPLASVQPPRRGLVPGRGLSGRGQLAVYRIHLRRGDGHQPARNERRFASAVDATGAARSGDLQPLHDRGLHRRGGGGSHRSQRAFSPGRGVLPRHRQDAQTAILYREHQERRRKQARAARPRHEHADHHRPRQGRRGFGPKQHNLPQADYRLHRAAPRHDLGRVFL